MHGLWVLLIAGLILGTYRALTVPTDSGRK